MHPNFVIGTLKGDKKKTWFKIENSNIGNSKSTMSTVYSLFRILFDLQYVLNKKKLIKSFRKYWEYVLRKRPYIQITFYWKL